MSTGLITASAAIVLVLGIAHIILTLFTRAFSPRDNALEERLKAVSPRLSPQMTMWGGWIGFNASHAVGAILFGFTSSSTARRR